MSEPVDLNARRWGRCASVHEFKPADALREALRLVESGEFPADHVIVVMGRLDGDGGEATYRQAGSFDVHAQWGLIERAKLMMMGVFS